MTRFGEAFGMVLAGWLCTLTPLVWKPEAPVHKTLWTWLDVPIYLSVNFTLYNKTVSINMVFFCVLWVTLTNYGT